MPYDVIREIRYQLLVAIFCQSNFAATNVYLPFIIMEKALLLYVCKNGFHFTEEMAEEAISTLTFCDGAKPIPKSNIKTKLSFLTDMYRNKNNFTDGDIIFASNKAKALLYPDILCDDAACIEYAISLTDDANMHEGVMFAHWIADCFCKSAKEIEFIV